MIYFDNAATTLRKPDCVAEAVMAALCSMGNPGRGIHEGAMSASRTVFDARCALAKLFGAESPERIAFTANSTEALNMAIKGVLMPGDHVITTALEHNSVLRPLYEMEDRGVGLTVLPADAKGNLRYEDIEAAIRQNTRAIVCTHGSNLTGNVVDIRRVGEAARKHNVLFIVDASQTAGVFPIDVQRMHIDILCFTGHKGLLGPQGTGGLYVREGVAVKPLLSGGSGVQTYLRNHPPQMPTALEAGTLNTHGIAGLLAAVHYIEKTGMENIRKTEQTLMEEFYRAVSMIPGITVYGDFTDMDRCPIVSLNVRDYDSGLISDVLAQEYGIATRPGAHCAPLMHKALGTVEQGAVRFSFAHFNTREEIKIAVSALRELAQEEN
ncbi:MAG: aminotransferase class V-fold PLP-dependent enzyme [Clostridia bacterium]|nr:aminotransferase class V-fold PLP-dependent enzyme [Clostridia bacterium]